MPKEQTEPPKKKNNPSHDDFPPTTSAASYTEPDFQERLHDLQNTAHDLDKLSNEAETLIADFSTHEEGVFTYRNTNHSIHLDKVLKAMLFYANDAGGEPSRRYVASAIVASSRLGSIPRLRALGITWVTHFLYVFKSSGIYHILQNKKHFSRGSWCNVLSTTTTGTEDSDDANLRSFRRNVLKRDGLRCVATGCEHHEHPVLVNGLNLQACRILPPEIFEADQDAPHVSAESTVGDAHPNTLIFHTSQYASARITCDIFRRFTCLDDSTWDHFRTLIGGPSNGITLDGREFTLRIQQPLLVSATN